MHQDLILIVGGRGTVGAELAKLLKGQGLRTRITTSQEVAATEEVAPVNLLTGEGIKAAFQGVDKAFFLSPPGHADQHALLSPLIQEAKRRGLKKVVLMTAMGANAVETSPFRRAEIELEKSGLRFNIIRPNWFLQNFHTFWIQGIQEQNKILLPAGNAKVSFIDARDIAATAARLLISSAYDQQAFDLTGPEAVDHAAVAAAIAKVAGRKIEYQEVSPADFKSGLLSAGLPAAYADVLVMLFGFLREGYAAGVTNHVQAITGSKPRSLETYVTDHQQQWKK